MSFDGYFWLGVLELLGRGMSQDQASGAAGNAFGREMAPRIANAIGAVMLGSRSNEATYGANRIVIKCAAPNTSSVGVTYIMLAPLHSIFGAFQQADGSFRVLALSARVYAQVQRATRSQGAAAGKVGLVSRSVFEEKGTHVKTVRV